MAKCSSRLQTRIRLNVYSVLLTWYDVVWRMIGGCLGIRSIISHFALAEQCARWVTLLMQRRPVQVVTWESKCIDALVLQVKHARSHTRANSDLLRCLGRLSTTDWWPPPAVTVHYCSHVFKQKSAPCVCIISYTNLVTNRHSSY